MSSLDSAPRPVRASVATPQDGLPAGVPRPCARCGTVLSAPRRGQRFCSARCWWKRWAEERAAEREDLQQAAADSYRRRYDVLAAEKAVLERETTELRAMVTGLTTANHQLRARLHAIGRLATIAPAPRLT